MHQGLYSAVVRSLQHYDRLQSHSGPTSSSQDRFTSQQVPDISVSLWHMQCSLIYQGFREQHINLVVIACCCNIAPTPHKWCMLP